MAKKSSCQHGRIVLEKDGDKLELTFTDYDAFWEFKFHTIKKLEGVRIAEEFWGYCSYTKADQALDIAKVYFR